MKNRAVVKKGRDKALLRNKTLINTAKDIPCADCNIKYPFYIMQFDHRPGEIKKFMVSDATRCPKGITAILTEIAKCDVVCANCHITRTYRRMTT